VRTGRLFELMVLLIALLATVGHGPPGLAPIRDLDSPYRISNEYMIFFNAGAPPTAVRSAVNDLQADYPDVELLAVWDHLEPRGFAAKLPQTALLTLRRNPHVDHISSNIWGFVNDADLSTRTGQASR